MDQTPKRLDWSDHAGKVVFACPCLAAAVSWAVISVAEMLRGTAPVALPPAVIALLFLNAASATIGSAVGGALTRNTLFQRVLVSLAAGMFGFTVFCALVVCPNIIGPPTH